MKFSDVKPNSLVTLKLHNGKGRKITFRRIFVSSVVDNMWCYDTPTGRGFICDYELTRDKTEIVESVEI